MCECTSLYYFVPDEGNLLLKFKDCAMVNRFTLYLMCSGVMLLILAIYTNYMGLNKGMLSMKNVCSNKSSFYVS